MKSKLVTYPRNDLLHLTVLKLNELVSGTAMHTNGAFMIAVDGNTEDNNGAKKPTTAVAIGSNGKVVDGFMFGQSIQGSPNYIRVDSGLDTGNIAPNQLGLYPDELRETHDSWIFYQLRLSFENGGYEGFKNLNPTPVNNKSPFNNSGITITPDGGFGGFVSRVRYYPYYITPQHAWNIYKEGFGDAFESALNKYNLSVSLYEDRIEQNKFFLF